MGRGLSEEGLAERCCQAEPGRGRRLTDVCPRWVKPQLSRLVKTAPDGQGWAHELKYDGYRMHGRLENGRVNLLTRTGLDRTGKNPQIAEALAVLPAETAYLDGQLVPLPRVQHERCRVGPVWLRRVLSMMSVVVGDR